MNTQFKLLLIIPQLGYGGAEADLLRLADHFSREAQVTIALMARDYGGGGYSSSGSTTDLPIELLDGGRSYGASLWGKVRRWRAMIRRLRVLKREHDASISFLCGANLLSVLAGENATTIISERGSKRYDVGMSNRQRLLWTAFLDRIAYRLSARIVPCGLDLAHEIEDANPWAAGKIVTIEGSVHSKKIHDAALRDVSDDLSCLRDTDLIVTVGRLHTQKGFDFLLRAFAELKKSRPDARLLIIGDGPDHSELVELALSLGLTTGPVDAEASPSVIFAGYREMPARYFRLGKVIALPSRFEGLPNALIEAVASGVPILASDCPWGPRSVMTRPGDSFGAWPVNRPTQVTYGTLMPVPDSPGAIDWWANELSKALSRADLAHYDGHAAIARFDVEHTGPEWLRLARSLADNRHPPAPLPTLNTRAA